MKLVDRYILRAFFTNYLVALAVMIGIYVVLDLFVNLDEFTKTSTSLAVVLRNTINFYGWNLFLYFSQLAGVIVLVAACFTLGRFLRTNELTAILAAGTSLYRVAAPILVAGLGLNLLWVVNQELVIPRIADKLARRHDDIEGRKTYAIWCLRDRDNALVSAGRFDPHTSLMEGLIVMRRDAEGRLTELLRADSARWDVERGVWHLSLPKLTRNLGRADADAEVAVAAPPSEYPSDLTPYELKLRQASQWTTFLGAADLTRLAQRYTNNTEFIRAKHARLTTPFVNILLLLMGIPFFLNRERPSVIAAGGRCLLVCGACFVFSFFCQNTDVTRLTAHPALPAWLPLLIFTPFAIVLVDSIKT
jgi:lipopolysaccharide export system permease protein